MVGWDPVALPSLVAFFASALLAILVLATNPRRVANRRLALVLALESLYAASQVWTLLADLQRETMPRWMNGLVSAVFIALSGAYLFFLSLLDTPLARPFRRRLVQSLLVVFLVAMTASGFIWGTPAGTPDTAHPMVVVNGVIGGLAFVAISIYGIAVTVSAYRRATPGTLLRAQAGALLTSFVLRDVIWIGSIAGGILTSDIDQALSENFWVVGPALAVIFYVPLLAYGILSTQLFDIDLKIKIGIRRGTIVGIFLAAVFVAAKVVETYLNRTIGFVAGSAIAGVLLFLVPKLNRIGEKVANAAMPTVQPTPIYLQFKKLEVYRAAVESANETGGITDRERATLDRLREKLGLARDDVYAVEQEIAAPVPGVSSPLGANGENVDIAP